jgi:hypothetical protein|tara:strand:- start:17 stop:331 length:315 start_codon:yes stop_codon:yes gene_type:complete
MFVVVFDVLLSGQPVSQYKRMCGHNVEGTVRAQAKETFDVTRKGHGDDGFGIVFEPRQVTHPWGTSVNGGRVSKQQTFVGGVKSYDGKQTVGGSGNLEMVRRGF